MIMTLKSSTYVLKSKKICVAKKIKIIFANGFYAKNYLHLFAPIGLNSSSRFQGMHNFSGYIT